MSLPKHIILSACVPDPHQRVNHIYHADTDEVLHVSADIAAAVRKKSARTQNVPKSKDTAEVQAAPVVPTPAEDGTDDDGMTGEETQESPDRAELLQMAQALGLAVDEETSDVDLQALVEKAVQA